MKMDVRKNTGSKFRKIALAAVGVLMIAVIGYGGYLYISQPRAANDVPTEPAENIDFGAPTNEEKVAAADEKQQAISEQNDKVENSDTPTAQLITVSITRASQIDSVVSIRSFVGGVSDGVCTTTLTKEGQSPVTEQTAIVFEGTTAACNTDIAVSKFGAGGDWELSITASKDGKSSKPTTQTIHVNK